MPSEVPHERFKSSSKPLGDSLLNGFTWLAGRTVFTRLVQYGGQVVLAWILEPKAFGLIGLAYSIQTFAALVQQSGIDKVLVAKQGEFEKLANPGFWGALTTGLTAGTLMAIAAPIASDLMNSPELAELVWILALATPFKALWLVPNAWLSIDLRFDTKAIVTAASVFAQMLLTIVLATGGYGAKSFVLPFLVVNPITAVGLYALTRPPIKWSLEVSKWPGLAKASGFLLLATVFKKIVFQGDYLLLGWWYPEDKVGIYYIAFSLSVQSVMLLSNNVTNTLFPILSKLKEDSKRQVNAFLRTARTAAVITIPVSFLLAVLAKPLIRLLLDARWIPAIPILQILAIGMALRVLESMAYAHLNAQGRFRTVASVTGLGCLVFIGLSLGAVMHGLEWFAVAVASAYLLNSLLYTLVALDISMQSFKEIVRIVSLPLVSSVTAGFFSLQLQGAVPLTISWNVFVIASTGFIFLVTVTGFTYFLDQDLWSEIVLIKEKAMSAVTR